MRHPFPTASLARCLRTSAVAAAAALCAAGAAQAQTAVTLYGVVDAGVSRVNGLPGGTVNSLVSGIMDGSRLGVRVNEDLGGGWRALATLEHRLELDTGLTGNRPPSGSRLPDRVSQAALLGLPAQLQPVVAAVAGNIGNTVGVNLGGAFWDRQAFLGLVTPVGAILAGRQYTPAYELAATFDTLGTQSALAAGQVASLPASIDIRLSNTLAYRIVAGGLTASAMVGAGEGSQTTGRFMGAMAIYKTGPFSAGVAYNTRENERGAKSLTNTVVGASMAIGPGTVSGLVASVKDENPSGLSGIAALVTPQVGAANAAAVQAAFVNGFRQDGRLMHVGYRFTTGPTTLYTAVSKFDDRRAANADTTSYGVTASYALSRRTDLNASLVRFDNNPRGQAAPGAAGYLGGVTAAAGVDSTSLSVGVRHKF